MIESTFDYLTKKYLDEVLPYIDQNLKKALHGGLNAGSNRFELILPSENNVFSETKYFKPKGTNLLHFTSLRNLFSIITDGSIRAYDLNNSNDPKELTHALETFNYSSLEKEEIEKAKRRTLTTSFCNKEKVEDLTMWRLYGQNGRGVTVIFSVMNDPIKWNGYHLADVQYNPLVEFQTKHKIFLQEHPDVVVDFSKLLSFHKAPYFKVEEEVRLIYNKHTSNTAYNFFIRDVNRLNQRVNYLKINLKEENGKNTLKDNIPLLKMEKVIIGFQLSNQFETIKTEIQSYSRKVLGYIVDVELSNLVGSFC